MPLASDSAGPEGSTGSADTRSWSAEYELSVKGPSYGLDRSCERGCRPRVHEASNVLLVLYKLATTYDLHGICHQLRSDVLRCVGLIPALKRDGWRN